MRGVPVVFVHVHYPDVWAEMAAEIGAAFSRPFGLVLTCRDEGMELAAVDSPHLAFCERVTVENRGRDVLPFMKALQARSTGFEIGLKLHTKRSTHREDGEDWRRFLARSLLAGGGGNPFVLDAMEREPRIGLVAPEAHLLELRSRIVLNRRITRRMIDAMSLDLDLGALETRRFAAGSMFWFRRDALLPFADPSLDRLFVAERGQLDGTAAHAAERLFAAVAETRGYLATATEALEPLSHLDPAKAPLDDLRRVSERAVASSRNPFILPLAQFWRRYPVALVAAHYLYAYAPKPVWRTARAMLKRFTVDR
ncbi:rhamnan synthesis F family protein [Aureimonas sp. ME7]|uniref:rhamnan synthesis F family protein n=1 Tax=Aureimonas sp. ME7 TaxID=2744252 RepID=UPI0015F7631D|nr:rhamnan synthesis F family protein [Aureimonas sp. ME7]